MTGPGASLRRAGLALLAVWSVAAGSAAEERAAIGTPTRVALRAEQPVVELRPERPGRIRAWSLDPSESAGWSLRAADGDGPAGWQGAHASVTGYFEIDARPDRVLVLALDAAPADGVLDVVVVSCGEAPADEWKALADEELRALLAATDAPAVADEIWSRVVRAAAQLGPRGMETPLRAVAEHRERVLPPGHDAALIPRTNAEWQSQLLGDVAGARERLGRAIDAARARRGAEDPGLDAHAVYLAHFDVRLGDAAAALRTVDGICARLAARSEDDIDRIWALQIRANALTELGRIDEALAIWADLAPRAERVYGRLGRDVSWALSDHARALREAGRAAEALALDERVLEMRRAVLDDGHEAVLVARAARARSLVALGRLEEAIPVLTEVVESLDRQLGADHADVVGLRSGLGGALYLAGRSREALEVLERAHASAVRALHADSPRRISTAGNLALALCATGELERAVELQSEVLIALERTGNAGTHAWRRSLQNLAVAVASAGDLPRARDLASRSLRAAEESLPETALDLHLARATLAWIQHDLGDFAGARELLELAVARMAEHLPDAGSVLVGRRLALAHLWSHLGGGARTRALLEAIIAEQVGRGESGGPLAQSARENLAESLLNDRRWSEALAVLDDIERSGEVVDGPRHRTLRVVCLMRLERLGEARGILEAALRDRELRQLTVLDRRALADLALVAHLEGDAPGFHAAALEAAGASARDLDASLLRLSPAEAEHYATRVAPVTNDLLRALAVRPRDGDTPATIAALLCATETLRSAALVGARGLALAGADGSLAGLRAAARSRAEDLVLAAQGGADRTALARAQRAEDDARRAWVDAVADRPEAVGLLATPTADEIALRLGPGAVAVSFRECVGSLARLSEHDSARFVAFVVAAGREPALVDLGPTPAIEAAVEAWRARLLAPIERAPGLGAPLDGRATEDAGAALAALLVEPLRAHVADRERWIVVPDGVLHAVPFDALPDATRPGKLLGDTWRIEVRASLRELSWPVPAKRDGPLVAAGGLKFDGGLRDAVPVEAGAANAPPAGDRAWDRGFGPLPSTGAEVAAIAQLYRDARVGSREPVILSGDAVSSSALEAEAECARWLHVATHGWFAPESVAAPSEHAVPQALRDLPGATRIERVMGLSPLVLAGLALSGANDPAGSDGIHPGLVTAAEIAAWDLRGCELAVLSACDTNVGVRRAGRGVASLQRALHMAGARSAITSLWKVPDEATRELMVDFYRRLWVRGLPKARALWEAKRRMRDARGPDGGAVHAPRDWAGWVLTGEPE